mmetsp:Transcript_25794/g.39646  ORF Transcript_25794/g.39646 Transcript_25794/m.39646 type:complete len:206 (-) Transcript_25794:280-897(-)
MRQFALLICKSIYSGPQKDVEDNIISLFADDLKGEPLWDALKDIMFHIVQSINENKMHIPIRINSEHIKQTYGFKPKAITSGFLSSAAFTVQKKLDMHIAQLPLPSCMPVWLKCQMDTNYIMLEGTPGLEHKGETTYIRVFNIHDFIEREFKIFVEEPEELSHTATQQMDHESLDRSNSKFSRSFSKMFTQTYRSRWRSVAEMAL